MGERSVEGAYEFQKSPFEQKYGISRFQFESETGYGVDRLYYYSYSPEGNEFHSSSADGLRAGPEVAVSPDSSTMFIFPPNPKQIKIEDLAVMALPATAYIDSVKPDIVIGCDRGARPYALAVHGVWGATKKSPFPTIDGNISFARLSTSLDRDIIERKLHGILLANIIDAKAKHINRDKLKVMFVDDLIASGQTRQLIMESLDNVIRPDNIQASFIVMCGGGGDATGSSRRVSMVWHDDEEMLGITYDKSGNPHPNVTAASVKFRRQIFDGVSKVAGKRVFNS